MSDPFKGQPNVQNRNNEPVMLQPQHHKTVLVKFSVKDLKLVPPSIARRRREDEADSDVRHGQKAQALGMNELAQVGRDRAGRVDTGYHAVDNLGPVHLAMLVKGLASNGYHFVDAHCAQKSKPYRDPNRRGMDRTNVVTLVFAQGEDRKQLTPELEQALLEIRKMVWQYCHVWDNAISYSTITVNLGGPVKDGNPKWAIVVRKSKIQAIPIEKPVTADEE
ncbi:MAG TPA: hypothetical protein VJI33_02790 [Candidatus Paceibacterota bacterium]